jgi:DNA-binding HxlR family transcriptional regulator
MLRTAVLQVLKHSVKKSAIVCQVQTEHSDCADGSQLDDAAPLTAPDYCPVHAAIQLLQEKWTLHIVRALLDSPMGFNELGRAVGGCNPATLKARLESLERLAVVTRTVQSFMPPRTSYELTPAGVDLQRVITAIDGWGREHLAQPSLPGLEASLPEPPTPVRV